MEFLQLKPATGLEVSPCLSNEFGPVGDSHADGACVDEVEALVEVPLFGRVVDDEGAVNRYSARLNG